MNRRIVLLMFIVVGLLLATKSGASGEKAADVKNPAKERLNAARQAYGFAWSDFKAFDLSKGDGEKVYRWSRRWMESERARATNKAQRLAAYQSHLERMKNLEKEVHDYQGGTLPLQQMVATAYYRAEAQTWLAAEKGK